MQPPIPFSLTEIKCIGGVAKNIDTYLDALTSNELEKIGIMKEDTLFAVITLVDERSKSYTKTIESYTKLSMSEYHFIKDNYLSKEAKS